MEEEVAKNPSTQFLTKIDSFYYGDKFKEWENIPIPYSVDIALENYFSSVLDLPMDRIIYASLNNNIRERTRKNGGQLNLPYMSYYKTGMSKDVDRPWFNNYANRYGLLDVNNENYETVLGKAFRIYPLRIEYEGVIMYSQDKDCEYAYNKFLFETSNETVIHPKLETDKGDIINNIGICNFDLEWNPDYDEIEWLETNRIWTIGVSFTVDTFGIGTVNKDISVCKEVIMDFVSAKNITLEQGKLPNFEESITLLSDYFEN